MCAASSATLPGRSSAVRSISASSSSGRCDKSSASGGASVRQSAISANRPGRASSRRNRLIALGRRAIRLSQRTAAAAGSGESAIEDSRSGRIASKALSAAVLRSAGYRPPVHWLMRSTSSTGMSGAAPVSATTCGALLGTDIRSSSSRASNRSATGRARSSTSAISAAPPSSPCSRAAVSSASPAGSVCVCLSPTICSRCSIVRRPS